MPIARPRPPASIWRAGHSTSGPSTSFTPAHRQSTPPSACARAPRLSRVPTSASSFSRAIRRRRSKPTTGGRCAPARAAPAVAPRPLLRGRGITLTTESESPAGAGIAGSSALNVAVCAALAEWKQRHYEPEVLLQIAMNVEAQAIARAHRTAGLSTGDVRRHRRPRARSGRICIAFRSTWTSPSSSTRLVLCYTGEPRNSGTNNWDITKRHIDGDQHVFDCFERIRDTAAAMREALGRGDWDAVGRAVARGMGQPQAPGSRRLDSQP